MQQALYAAVPSLAVSPETVSVSDSYAQSAADYVRSGYSDTDIVSLVESLRKNFANVAAGSCPVWDMNSVRDRLLIAQHCAEVVKQEGRQYRSDIRSLSTKLGPGRTSGKTSGLSW